MQINHIQKDIEAIIESLGCKLYDMVFLRENATEILRIYIMANKVGGVTLDMCQMVSEAVSPFLDVKDISENAYILEVSSPGADRTLKIPRHFMLSCGERVKIHLPDKSDFEATILKANEEGVWVDTIPESLYPLLYGQTNAVDSNAIGFIPYNKIRKAKIAFEFH